MVINAYRRLKSWLLDRLGDDGHVETVVTGATAAFDPKQISPAHPGAEDLGQTLKEHKADLDRQLKQQADELVSVRKFLDTSLKKEIANATRQIEAVLSLQNYFATGELPNINTERHSWPVSPDFSLYLIELLETNPYDLIIEFGSGMSTVILAKTLAKIPRHRAGKAPVALVSFDHLEKYYDQTLVRLRQADLVDRVQLELAPLAPYTAPNGTSYPAAPAVMHYFKGAHLSFLLDDFMRDDEREIAALWQAEFSGAGLAHTTTLRSLEKDACLITVSAEAIEAGGLS
jgi:predicted O-methyltransferase YrrM